MLTDVVQLNVTVGVAPQPALGSIIARAVLITAGQIPERNRDIVSIDPLPRVAILRVAHRAHPVLRVGVASMPSPQLPADESLQRRVRLVDQGATACSAELHRVPERQRLPVVERVALAVVGGRCARGLIPEDGAPLNGQGLVCVDERLADGERARYRILEMHGHKGARHGWVARQEEGLPLLEHAGESVADRIGAQVRSVVSDSHHHCRRFVVT